MTWYEMELLACMSIAGSVPVVICLFIYIIQSKIITMFLEKDYFWQDCSFIWFLCSWLNIWFRKKLTRKCFLMKKPSYICPILCPSGMKERANIFGCRNGLMLLRPSGWLELLYFLFMNLSNIVKRHVQLKIIFSKQWMILKIILLIIWYPMGSAVHVR